MKILNRNQKSFCNIDIDKYLTFIIKIYYYSFLTNLFIFKFYQIFEDFIQLF